MILRYIQNYNIMAFIVLTALCVLDHLKPIKSV